MILKLSKFNVYKNNTDGNTFIFNTLYRSMFMVENRLLEDIRSGKDPVNVDDINKLEDLKARNLIVYDNIDENKVYLYYCNKLNYDTKTAAITLFTTYNCNLKCAYCFQQGPVDIFDRKNDMSIDVAKKTLIWVKSFIESRRPRIFTICFFGGEPLLNMEVVEFFIVNLREFAAEKKFGIAFTMVSNGTLLDRKNAEQLYNLGLRRVAVTIDGPEEIHNVRRPFKNGAGTYQTILRNIIDTIDILKLRINITLDKHNVETISTLLDSLEENNLKKKIPILFGTLMQNPWNLPHCSQCVGTGGEMGEYLHKSMKLTLERGFNVEGLYHGAICPFTNDNEFTISPDGGIYKCISGTGIEDFKIGNVNEKLNALFARSAQKVALEPWRNETCLNCPYIPLCGGGCRYQAYTEGKSIEARWCQKNLYEKGDLELMKFIYSSESEKGV